MDSGLKGWGLGCKVFGIKDLGAELVPFNEKAFTYDHTNMNQSSAPKPSGYAHVPKLCLSLNSKEFKVNAITLS